MTQLPRRPEDKKVAFIEIGSATVEDRLLALVSGEDLLSAMWFHERGIAEQWPDNSKNAKTLKSGKAVTSQLKTRTGVAFAIVTSLGSIVTTKVRFVENKWRAT